MREANEKRKKLYLGFTAFGQFAYILSFRISFKEH